MAVHLITYYIQETSHDHAGCGCDNHTNDSCGCESEHNHEHEHGDSCGCGSDHEHEHGENCGCGGDPDYDLITEIETLGRWAQFMPTAFLVDTTLNSDEILDRLSPTIGARDLLFVSKVNSSDVACLTPQVKAWIEKVESESK